MSTSHSHSAATHSTTLPLTVTPSSRDEAILAHTNLLSLHISPTNDANNNVNVASPSVIALQNQIAAYLPTREWFRIPMQLDPTEAYISHFSLQHGSSLPALSVRVLESHVICDEVRGRELDSSLQWLMESIGVGSSYPVLGVDCESDCTIHSAGEVRLLQLSTGTRCLLIRIPDQATLREVVGYATLEKQVAAASGSAPPLSTSSNSGNTHSHTLFTPSFHSLMSNRSIFKSGAELWTDALDLWSCTGTGVSPSGIVTASGVEMNSCLNMSWIYRNEHGGALSLAAMVNLSLASDRCFLKDKPTTTSDWGAKQLNLRQLIYAALDAQASFIAGANQSQIPKPFHVGDMPKSWLSTASSWKQILRSTKMIRESRGGTNRYHPTADSLLDAAFRYFAQVMQGEEPFHPFLAALFQVPFPTPQQAAASMPPPNAHLIHNSGNRMPLSATYFQGEDLAIETSHVNSWWFANSTELNQRTGLGNLSTSEQQLHDMLDRSRISVVCGATGSGLTTAAAMESLRSLQRSSTIPLEHSPPHMSASGQRVLLLTETEHGARAAAEVIAKYVSPADAMLLITQTYLESWALEPQSESSQRAKQLVPPTDEDDRSILICSIDYALSLSAGGGDATIGQWRLHHRQTVIVDDAAQVWLLKLVLLLRRLPHTERLILFGDERSHQSRWGDIVVDDVLSAALIACRSTTPARAPPPFRVARHRLQDQWRMYPHIAAGVSEAFYLGRLPLGAMANDPSIPKQRGIGWVEVQSEDSLVQSIRSLWNHFIRLGLRWDQVVIMVMSESARLAVTSALPNDPTFVARIHTPESFQGRGAEVALVILQTGLDKRRLLVACSRASQKLFLFGERSQWAKNSRHPGDAATQSLASFEARDIETVFSHNSFNNPNMTTQLMVTNDDASHHTVGFPANGDALSEETFPSLSSSVGPSSSSAPTTSSTRTPLKQSLNHKSDPSASVVVTSPPVPTASWAGGTLSFTKAATNNDSASNASESRKKAIATTNGDKKSTVAPSAAVAPTIHVSVPLPSKKSDASNNSPPVIEFQIAPDNKAWKVLPCDKLHSVDGRRPSGTCHAGEKCGFLHNDFWIRRGAVGEFVLCTPGSRIALVEVVEPWNERRLRQMETLVDSKLNRANRDRAAKEFAHLFPVEEPTAEEQPTTVIASTSSANSMRNSKQPSATTSSSPNSSTAKPLAPTTAAQVVSAATASAAFASSSSPASMTSASASPSSSSLPSSSAPPTSSDLVDDSSSRSTRSKRGGRKKVTVAPSHSMEDESSTISIQVPGADDFVPVSRRHASKHPSNLAATLAAEMRASEAAQAEQQLQAEIEAAEEAAARERERQQNEAAQQKKLKQQQKRQQEEEEAAAVLAEEEAAAEAAAAAAAEEEKASKKKSNEPTPPVEYPADMPTGSWWLPDELAALSKNARKKLLWLCPACRAPNANGDAKCSLCNGSKPLAANIRYAKPPGSLGPLPREVEGKYAYESEWVKLVSSSSGGAPTFVASKPIPAGTVILREDAFYSEVSAGPNSKTAVALVPQPRACAQLAAQLLADPVQMAFIRARWAANPWSDGQLKLFLRNAESASGVPSLKPKDPNLLKDWPMVMAFAATAKYAREDQEGHAMECKCHRFKLPRQSSLLLPSCWPNTAVVCLHTDPMLTPDQMAILAVTDIPVGTVLTNVSDQALLNLPADRRQQTISLSKYRSTGRACHCERCSGKLAQEQEKLLLQEIPGYTVDKLRMPGEYDKVMIAYSETQHSKQRVYKPQMMKDKDGHDVLAPPPKDGVSDAAYFALCYGFLALAFDFLTSHPLHPCHWRMQKVRELYLSLVRCDFLYRTDYMTLSGLVSPEGQHATLRQIVHVLDAAIRSDQQFFLVMEPMKSLPLLTLLELCTFLIQNKVTIRPAPPKAIKDSSNSTGSSKQYKVECLEFEGIGRFDSQAAFLLNLSQLNQYAAIIRALNFPYRRT